MELTEEEQSRIIQEIQEGNYDLAAEAVTGKLGDNDHNDVVAEFLEKLAIDDNAALTSKLSLIAEVARHNINQPVNILRNALFNAFPGLSSKTTPNKANDSSGIEDQEIAKMSLEEIENKLKVIKSEQAKLIRTNQPLDSAKSKMIKSLQAAKEKLEKDGLALSEDAEKENDSWFNFASVSEIGSSLAFEVCQGTAVLATVKRRIDKEIKEGHVVLSQQPNTRASQEKEYIDLYNAEMPGVTDGDMFIKEVAEEFREHKKIPGKLLEHKEGIDQGAIYQFAGGWLIFVKERKPNEVLPSYNIFPINIADDAYYTIKISHLFKGGNVYPDAYSIFEFKGNRCISYVSSEKGVEVVDRDLLDLLKSQVKAYNKNFSELVINIPNDIYDQKPEILEKEALSQVAKMLRGDKQSSPKPPQTETNKAQSVDKTEPAGKSASASGKENPTATKKPEQAAIKDQTTQKLPASPETQEKTPKNPLEANSTPSDQEDDNIQQLQEEEVLNPKIAEIEQKIDNLSDLLEQAKINDQTSTITRLEEDIAELQEEKEKLLNSPYDPEEDENLPENQQQSPEDNNPKKEQEEAAFPDEDDQENEILDPEDIAAALAKTGLSEEFQDKIVQTLTSQNYHFETITKDEALRLLEEEFGELTYDDLLKFRNGILHAKLPEALHYFDNYMLIYIELAYIAGDYKNRADKILEESLARSNQIVAEEQQISEKLAEYENKNLEAKDLKDKLELQNKLEKLEEEGMQLTLNINMAKLYLDANIAEIEKHDPHPAHVEYRLKNKEQADAETNIKNNALLKDYQNKLEKISKKIPEVSKEKFALKSDILSHQEIEKFDLSHISAEDLVDLAVACGKPIDLADQEKAESVLKLTKFVKSIDHQLGDFFKKVEKHKNAIKKIKKELDHLQQEIIAKEREIEAIQIANKVRLTPITEEKKLIKKKLAKLEG